MLNQEENRALVALLDKLTWPVALEVFFALAKKTILPSVDLAITRKRDSVAEVLLTRRPANDPFFALLWHIPGGIIMPGQTALSTVEKRVLKPDVGIVLSREPELLMERDILMGDAGPHTSPRGQEVYRLYHYILGGYDPEIPVDGIERVFCRLDEIPAEFVQHQLPSIEQLRTVYGV